MTVMFVGALLLSGHASAASRATAMKYILSSVGRAKLSPRRFYADYMENWT
ncbi:hypothetical protein CY34DRAFT_800271, partial [Suillus luteus UH-Slu-Lm8-n1]